MDEVSFENYRYLFSRYTSPIDPLPTTVSQQLPNLDIIEVILFDVYGTLVISASGDVGTIMEESENALFCRMLKKEMDLVLPADIPVEKLLKTEILKEHAYKKAQGIDYPEVDIRSIWQRVLTRIFPSEHFQDDARMVEKIALLHELSRNRVWPMPGSMEVLSLLHEKFRIGIVSNAQFYTPLMLNHFFINSDSVFDSNVCIWSYREGRAKPDSALFIKALKNLGKECLADPSRVLYVGNDMLNDISAASSAGMRTLLFAGDKRSLRIRNADPRVKNIQPDGILKNLNQMPQILGIGEKIT